MTTGRSSTNEIQVPSNHGSFLGVALDGETTWLRDLTVVEQYYASDSDDTDATFSDEVVTVYEGERLSVTVRDVVVRDVDALVRSVSVSSPADSATLVGFENINCLVSRLPQMPVHDWCNHSETTDSAAYDASVDCIVHETTNTDVATDTEERAAMAFGFAGQSSGHQVGADRNESGTETPADAYEDAASLPLEGSAEYTGHTTGVVTTDLDLSDGQATESVILAGARTPSEATAVLEAVRDRDFESDIRPEKESWFESLLGEAPMPATDDERIRRVCQRALVCLVTATEATEDRAIVASIATQAPYALDWIRDGAYFNYALEIAGLGDWVADRNRWYAEIQQTDDLRNSQKLTPPGNWAMNYYGDGIAGGPIPYELDETGYGIWTLWEHYELTGDEAYLQDVYPAIERAAEYLLRCRDDDTGLHCRTWEDDRFVPGQSIIGAAPAWLGLRSAVAAARSPASPGTESDANRYEDRLHELGRAIDRHLYAELEGGMGYGSRAWAMSEVAWPVCFTPYADPSSGTIESEPTVDAAFEHPRIQSHLERKVDRMGYLNTPEDPAVTTGQYETKTIIALAKMRQPEMLTAAERGLDWVVTHHATDDTYVMGEAWKVFENETGEPEVRSIVSQPHVWSQVLAYLAALEIHPPADLSFEAGTCGSVLDALRERQA
ncbi:MAG: hypothetical protein U5K37_03310 [Natrialbaceae archaeon]|nr:hypothetical protein [Natrialbaceae archaeon]